MKSLLIRCAAAVLAVATLTGVYASSAHAGESVELAFCTRAASLAYSTAQARDAKVDKTIFLKAMLSVQEREASPMSDWYVAVVVEGVYGNTLSPDLVRALIMQGCLEAAIAKLKKKQAMLEKSS